MRRAHKNPILLSMGLLAGLLLVTGNVAAQEASEIQEGPAKAQGPSKSDWVNAGLDPAEYAEAMSYEVGIHEWKELVQSRKNRRTAGWATVGVGVLGAGILATIYLAKSYNVTDHPQMEVFAISMVGVGAALLTGFVTALSAPGPEDFVDKWRRERGLSFDIGETTLHPGLNGLALTF